MELSELSSAPADPTERALRYERDGCLLVRDAVDPAQLEAISTKVTAALRAGGLAMATELRWSGAPAGDLEATGINDVPALDELVERIDGGTDPLRPVAGDICGKPMVVWRSLHVFAAVPDDPAHVTVPHQDNFAVRQDGDYRRLWIALSEIPFGDGGLGLAAGSHRCGRLPNVELSGFADRNTGKPATGIDPHQVGDRWQTAAMRPGDVLVFRPGVVHRGLPPVSDRIRLALAVIVSAATDPLPPMIYTGPENRARRARIRELAAPFGLSELQLLAVAADLNRAGAGIDAETVQAAAERHLRP
ncbi:phytanoyl-CoA dioxygenase family protein [Sciscionella marina]|uniref:phytanoyl-CoA dioxygenase family protein n=1 Tax=Sciscionella marina TaxID=508770 RepID=UPI00035F3B36|nr:phytanoyl-CoA dioxygenase family protein [Sciscionella marina]